MPKLLILTVALVSLLWVGRTSDSAEREDGALRRLIPPASTPRTLPKEWKIFIEPKDFEPKGGSTECGFGGELPESADELTRASVIVVVGVGVGSDGSFYRLSDRRTPTLFQYTTYYLKVLGYLKDSTGRRAPLLRIIAPGGFLDGGQRRGDRTMLPYIAAGRRYLLYLTPNHGLDWGAKGNTSSPVGTQDDYWTTGETNGWWYEQGAGQPNAGTLVGQVIDPWKWHGLGTRLPFGKAVERVQLAVQREATRRPPAAPRLPDERGILTAEYRKALLEQKAQEQSQGRD